MPNNGTTNGLKEETISSTLQPKERAEVVIVGAGMAGLAAAQRLYQSGVRDLVVLDALDRIGGRVHTVARSDYLLEMGAQWLHGAYQNPLYKWLTELNLLDDFEDASSGLRGVFCTPNGVQIDDNLVVKVVEIVCDSKSSLSKNQLDDMITSKGFKNAAQLFKHQLELKIDSDKQLSDNKSLVRSLFEWFLRYEQVENGCDSMSDVSVASYTDWANWGEGTLLNFKDGYRSLVDWFHEQLPSKQPVVYLNKAVTNIEMLQTAQNATDNHCWLDSRGNQHNSPVLVTYSSDTNLNGNSIKEALKTIECHHVIVTVSLGFLKKNHQALFRPPLPRAKQELIESIGFGTVNKIILQFEKPFWGHQKSFKLIWGENEPNLEEFPAWVRDIISFDVVRRQANHLIGWIGGQGARQMELEPEEQIGEICLQLLAKFLPKLYGQSTRLVSCTCSRWSSNPFVCGSYSFPSMQSYHLNADELQEPLYDTDDDDHQLDDRQQQRRARVPRVLFAGEATAGNLHATTHGAIISGWREADRLSSLAAKKWPANGTLDKY